MLNRISKKRLEKGETLCYNSTFKNKGWKIKKVSDKQKRLWHEAREKTFERYGRKCFLCGDSKSELAVHHFRYTRTQRPDLKYDIDNLIPVCRRCHNHNGADEKFYKLKEKITEKLKNKKLFDSFIDKV